MIRPAAAASLAVVATLALGLAACSSTAPQTSPRVATNEIPYRPGQGEVIAAMPARPPLNAAAGGSAAAPASAAAPTYRLAIRMSDGRVQYVDTDNPRITAGSRVELGADHTLRPL